MRPFEIAIVCQVLIGLLAARIFSRKPSAPLPAWLCCGLLVVALVLHLSIEGAHWQLGPLYLAVLATLILLLIHDLARAWKLAAALAVMLLVVTSCGLSFVKPMFSLPKPTGQFAVGTRIIAMTDTSRREDAIAGDQHPRELVAQIWYPAASSNNHRAAYRRLSETTWKTSHQSVVWTNARLDAPVAEGEFPILMYNPGWNGWRSQNTALTEELASHGYVVVAIDHPYNSGPVAVADGRVIQPVATPQLSDEVTSAEAVYALIDAEVAKETTDAQFVLAQVERMNDDSASPFYHRLGQSKTGAKIGALGYSLGGAVAAELALRDARVGAVMDLDTPLYGQAGKLGVRQPFLLLSEEIPHSTPEELARMSFGQRRDAEMDEDDYARQLPMLRTAGSYQIALHGTLHTSFQDGILMSPLQRFSGAGAIAPKRMISILRQYTVAFFDQSLRGVASPLLAAKTSPFPEAEVLYSSSPAGTQARK